MQGRLSGCCSSDRSPGPGRLCSERSGVRSVNDSVSLVRYSPLRGLRLSAPCRLPHLTHMHRIVPFEVAYCVLCIVLLRPVVHPRRGSRFGWPLAFRVPFAVSPDVRNRSLQ